MQKTKQAIMIALVVVLPTMISAESITISVGVRNLPPSFSEGEITLTEDTVCITFLVGDPNTLADLEWINVTIYEMSDRGLSIQKFSWKGLGTEWTPRPYVSFFPPLNLARQESFLFLLKVHWEWAEDVAVYVSIRDSAKNQTDGHLYLQNE